MNRLVNTVALALAVRRGGEGCTGQETERARDDGGFVGDDVAEQVARDDDTIQSARVLDHQHSSRVDEVVAELELRELLLHDLRDSLAPQPAGGHDVGLVERPDGRGRVLGQSEVGSEAGDALDLGARVGLRVERVPAAIVLFALAEVDSARELAHDVEVGAAAHFGFEGGGVDKGLGREEAGAQVAVRAHFFAQLQDALLRANAAGAPFGAADGAQQDGVGGFGGGESFVCQRGAGGVDGGLEMV